MTTKRKRVILNEVKNLYTPTSRDLSHETFGWNILSPVNA